jgi:carboxyl-terminal processing protease
MTKKVLIILITGIIGIFLLTAACSIGFVAGRMLSPKTASIPTTVTENLQQLPIPDIQTPTFSEPQPTQPPQVRAPAQDVSPSDAGTPQDLQSLFDPFWQTWNILHDQFVDQPLDNEALMRGAIDGMMNSLGDKHSSYMDPDQYEQANISLDGEYEGIGAWVDTNAEYLTIVSPMLDSPAEAAGLKPGDQIIAVDGEDMTGVDGNLVIRKVMGPAGSQVTLTILRGVSEPFDVDITRAKITVPSVTGKMLDNNVAYVQLLTFGDTTANDLHNTLQDLMDQNPQGLILDLRNNGGGYLNTAIDVASEFIDNGVVMYEQFGDGSRQEFSASGRGIATDIPMVVLVNEGTASASEIVSGAIQDYGRGKLVGVTTYGKGSVQQWIPLDNNEGAVRVTVARWLTPNEHQINEVGLTPDVVVEQPTPDTTTPQDVTPAPEPTDVQLQKAIEVLLGK